MEEITMERLLHNFSEVLADLNDIVERNDIEAARKALEEIETLVTNKEFVRLDDRQNAAMDHVLHDLLSQMSGVIEYETTRTFTDNPNPEPIPEPNKDDIERMRKELEEAKRWAKRLGDELDCQ